MNQNRVPITGIQMDLVHSEYGSYVLIRSDSPMRTLNSSPWGGGFGMFRSLMNRQVHRLYNEADPLREMDDFIQREGLNPRETAGMLTAAWVKDVGYSTLTWTRNGAEDAENETNPLHVCAWVTVGLGNKARAGTEMAAASLYPGTINTIVVIEGQLTDAAMVNAVITATEAKSAALQALGVEVDGFPATGTTTDAVLIATTCRGRLYSYAGTATALGNLIGRTVYEAILASGQLYEKTPD
ncbi:adenosylcobinamide amidohydrolase [Paenibacillus chondroitinus]|uniref:Adenosylcobinamide amidohydrolase n=1 Tax=Paenibacillus chondroitinus TaxID=59842 RepID=A0ABU6DD49_9BACL|nr:MULTISPECIES: adenosylcobinamide amidohydrolase [Paenibacillus]MCY9656393.1 adenosylcobinamide amidohydrolase [Paenibacillus anseongense]MEB4795217.1 adenosylcobinamide amidohydrolase [Paenibacillus chondroitinus]